MKVETLCINKRIKFTDLRKRVLKLIWESHIPLKAYDLLEKLKINDKSAKPITVYRILDIFLENKIIHKIESQNTYLGCSHPGEPHNCYFLICKECNKVEESCQKELLENIYNNLARNEFKPEHITLEIHGICKTCKK
jgi:Fur family zinc uptake transcriptional regulator